MGEGTEPELAETHVSAQCCCSDTVYVMSVPMPLATASDVSNISGLNTLQLG